MTMTRIPLAAAAALFFAAAPALAQQPAQDCPAPEPGMETPVEVRIAGMVLRAQVSSQGSTAAGDSARVEARLVSCEDPSRRGADAGAAAAPGDGLLRLLSDLRLGIQLTPSADGRCYRAQIHVSDDAADARRNRGDEPVGIELCGLNIGREPGVDGVRRM
jgi:hypothetical protein